jgi:1-aminocyclopropane-1-carboxylate deaminase/D-cysteine desulfhydrase-like pyridoxal-dependent ACC family enzyme
MTWRLPLFEQHPALARFPVAGLLAGPTRVEPLRDHEFIFLKRDDLTATDYGGNKIRKLDFLLADACMRGRKTVLAFGYAGSNFVAATAWHGRKLGLRTIGGLLPQVHAGYIADNLSVSVAAGATLFVRSSEPALVAEALLRAAAACLRDGALPMLIPPGGSSALGALGFVNAALELRQQVDGGAMPMPRTIVLPFSSMGSVAGLAAGLQLAGMDARIVAVQVVGERHASGAKLSALLQRLVTLLRGAGVAVADASALASRIDVRIDYFGGEYARADASVRSAIDRFEQATGARADSAYTGKALACLFAEKLQGPVLYWHTLSATSRPPGVPAARGEQLPVGLRQYLAPPIG